MRKLIRSIPADQFSGASKEWLIGDRFEVIIYTGRGRFNFFIDDSTNKICSLELTPQIARSLGLYKDPEITLTPSIDTCGILVPESRHDEIFDKIEKYLLDLEKKDILG